jgi:hypothetical protein
MSTSHRLDLVLVLACALALPGVASAQSDGLLGIYFDRDASRCTGSVGSGSPITMYVVLIGDGATSSGITGAEFRIEKSGAQSYYFLSETGFGNLQLGSPFEAGTNVGFSTCQSGRAIPVMSFQVLNPGGAPSDAILRITQHSNPSNRDWQCSLATLCDAPVFTKACIEGGKAVLNPAADRPCGSSREEAEWTRVKGLYKP